MKNIAVKEKYPFITKILLALVCCGILFLLCTGHTFARRADEATLEVEMAGRLETMLEKIVGKERALVKVKISLSQPARNMAASSLRGALSNLPGVAFPKAKPEKGKKKHISYVPTIEKIAVTVFLDDSIDEEKVNSVKEAVPKWMELDFDRGDTLKVELIPWKELPPEDIAIKQLSFLKGNLLAIAAVAGGIVLVFVIVMLLAIPARKIIRQRLKALAEGKKPPDLGAVISDLKGVIVRSTAGVPKNVDGLLEDIKGILAKAPTRMDSLLEEIRDVLEMISQTQPKSAEGGGGGRGGSEAGAQAALPADTATPDFLSALKETIAPFAQGQGGLSPEALQILQSIEEHIRKQLDASRATDTLDEPFKYLNSLSTRELLLYIDGEEPRIASIILGHIDNDKSAEILTALSDQRKLEIAAAMATLVESDKVSEEIRDFIQRKMPEVKLRADFTPVAGTKALATILGSTSYKIATFVLESLQKSNPAVAEAVKKEMFLFEDIAALENHAVEELLKSVDRGRLSLALCRASDAVKEKFYACMTERAVEMIKEEIGALLPHAPEGESSEVIFFEDIIRLDQKRFQQIFANIDRSTLKLALKGTSEDVRNKIYSVMTERGAAMLKEDIDVMPAITHERSVEAQEQILKYVHQLENEPIVAQQEIINKIRNLERAGRISLV